MDNSLQNAKRIFIIGIKGNGTSAIASILSSFGKLVEGSDVREDFITKPLLDRLSIDPLVFGRTITFKDFDLIIYSTSVTAENPDLALAKKEGIPAISYPEALGSLAKLFTTSIAVCGSHGKSTITSLLGYTLEQGVLDPTVLVGAEVVNWNGSARSGGEKYFVFEADEYQNKFRHYFPNILVVNNVNFEHPDFFKTFEEYRKAFVDFIAKLHADSLVVANRDHATVHEIVRESGKNVVWYGEDREADVRLTRRSLQDGIQTLHINGTDTYKLSLIGKHNALNALPVIALAKHFGMSNEAINKALSTFRSTKRRLEPIGAKDDKVVIDDFAHHPTEIAASIAALKEAYPKRRLVCIFQSHTFTRTEVLLDDFATAFKGADELILIPIFGSARETKGRVTTEDLRDAIKPHTPDVHIEENNGKALTYLEEYSKKGDLIVTMGAGDTWQIARDFVK